MVQFWKTPGALTPQARVRTVDLRGFEPLSFPRTVFANHGNHALSGLNPHTSLLMGAKIGVQRFYLPPPTSALLPAGVFKKTHNWCLKRLRERGGDRTHTFPIPVGPTSAKRTVQTVPHKRNHAWAIGTCVWPLEPGFGRCSCVRTKRTLTSLTIVNLFVHRSVPVWQLRPANGWLRAPFNQARALCSCVRTDSTHKPWQVQMPSEHIYDWSADELAAEIAKTRTAMSENPGFAVLMQAHLNMHLDEQARRRGPPCGNATAIGAQTRPVSQPQTPEEALPIASTTPLGANAAAAAAPGAPSGGLSALMTFGKLRAADLPLYKQNQWKAKMRERVMRVHAELCEKTGATIDPKTPIYQVLNAICKNQGSAFDADKETERAWLKARNKANAKSNHLVNVNGDIQRGKTNYKALMAAVVWEIFKDGEVCDKPFTVMVTTMVPWAQNLVNGVGKVTGAHAMASNSDDEHDNDPSDSDSNKSDSNDDDDDDYDDDDDDDDECEFVEDPDELDDPLAGGMPRTFVQQAKHVSEGIATAMNGGAIVIPRSKGALHKVAQIIHLVNKQARHSGDEAVVRWPMYALDECDQVPGSCTSALGQNERDETSREPRVYERLVNMLAGWEDLRKSDGVQVHYHKDTFAPCRKKSGITKSSTIYKSSDNMPFLVVGISGTNLGFFAWTVSRVGKPHKTEPTRPVFSALDVASFKETDASQYRGSAQATKFADQVLDRTEVKKDNKWCCAKTLAIESAASQEPGSCLMSCTTSVVNEGTKSGGISLQCAHYEHQVRCDVFARMGIAHFGQRLGRGEAGGWTTFMHGGHDAFPGKVGVEFSSPSDPLGLRKLEQLEALCRHHLAEHDAKNTELNAQIDALADTIRERRIQSQCCRDAKAGRKRLKAFRAEGGTLTVLLKRAAENFYERRTESKEHADEYQQAFEKTVSEQRRAQAARCAHEDAANARDRNEPNAPSAAEIEKLKKQKDVDVSRADQSLTSLTDQRHRASVGHRFNRSAFGQELLLPLLHIHESAQRENRRRRRPDQKLPPRQVKLPHSSLPDKKMLGTADVGILLGFLRSLDCECMLGALPSDLQAQSPEESSFEAPIKIVGQAMIRRSMSLVGSWYDERGDSRVLCTVSHVVQYSNYDGASQAQQIKRFCTTATTHRGNKPVQVLCTNQGWLAIKGHQAYNEMPEWRRSMPERAELLKRLARLMAGTETVRALSREQETRTNATLREDIKISNKCTIETTVHHVRIMRVMMELFDWPKDLAAMCRDMLSPLFPGTAGREYGAMIYRSRRAKRSLDPAAAGDEDDDEDDASQHQPKKKKTRGSGLLYDFCELAMQALGAFGDFETREGLANAVSHGQIWDMVESMQKHRLSDPVEAARLQRDEPTAYKIIDRKSRAGGVSQHLKIMAEKQGRIQMLHHLDPKNPTNVNLYIIKRNSATDAPGQASSSSASEAGTSSNAAVPAPTSTPDSTSDHVSDDVWHASEQAADHEAWANQVEQHIRRPTKVVRRETVTYYHESDPSVSDEDAPLRRKEPKRSGKSPAREHPRRKSKRLASASERLPSTTLRGPSTTKYPELRKAPPKAAAAFGASDAESSESESESENESESDDGSDQEYVNGTLSSNSTPSGSDSASESSPEEAMATSDESGDDSDDE